MSIEAIQAFARHSGIDAFMNSAWGWPAIESIHFIALATLLGTVGLFDLRVLGVAKNVELNALHRLVPFGAAAYLVNVFTGALFFVSAPDQYLYNPAFQLKLLCMGVAGVNVAIFYGVFAKSLQQPQADSDIPMAIKIIAAVSLASWLGVIVFGRLITYFRPPYQWCFWC